MEADKIFSQVPSIVQNMNRVKHELDTIDNKTYAQNIKDIIDKTLISLPNQIAQRA